jgi:hypothetical protein
MKRFALAYAATLLLSCSPDYQSGSTECSTDGKCPSGFVCGSASTAGALDVCYDANVARCTSPDIYYCPSSSTCWSGKVACDTVKDCGNGTIAACNSEGYTPDCSGSSTSGSSTCHYGGGTGAGGSGGGGGGGSTGICAPLSTDTACDTCQDNSCCSQMTACSNQASCHSLLTCINNCSSGDTTCMNSCQSSYSSGVTTLTTFITCVQTSCSASCSQNAGSGGSGGGTGGACPASSGDTACTTCDKQSCCSQFTACENQPACANLANCITACASGDTTCMNGCETSYPSGASNLTAWVSCLTSSCSASCN